ncbi:MAG: DUF924 family protein [Methylacidiphilales bacterium]|nr:DUF924 family protein [Candidatus Methylacidiphilales bacterium]
MQLQELKILSVIEIKDCFKKLQSYWFSESGHHAWFSSTKEIDLSIKENYLALWISCLRNLKYCCTLEYPDIIQAIITFDQLPLNMFRESHLKYQTSYNALTLSKLCVVKNIHLSASSDEKLFILLPFMHSELYEDQIMSCQLAEEWAIGQRQIEYAYSFKSIIEQFGRFPMRNDLLMRKSTKAELDFLKSQNNKK